MKPSGLLNGEKRVNRYFIAAVTAIMLLYLLIAVYRCILFQFVAPDFNNFLYTEYFISYEGGFVRRGLLGEILYGICVGSGTDPILLIQTICIGTYLFVAIYFVTKFRQKGLSLILLASPLMCGYLNDFIRKDYLLLGMLICMYLLLKGQSLTRWKITGALTIGILGLFIHEAFIFWGLPIIVLSLVSQKETRLWGMTAGVVFIGCFILFACFKGSDAHVHRIIDSWNAVFGTPLLRDEDHAIKALAWDTLSTVKMHLRLNFHSDAMGWWGIAIRPLWMLVIYYFFSNAIFTLKGNNSDAPDSEKTAYSALLLFSIACLLPMFIFLSCDYGRLYLYLTMSVTGAYITFTPARFKALLPRKVLCITSHFNSHLTKICRPGPYLILVLLLVTGSESVSFTPLGDFKASPFGTIIFTAMRHLACI